VRAGAATLAVLVLAAGCGGTTPAPVADTDLGSPTLSRADQEACTALVAALPSTLVGKARRGDVGAGPGAVWGDPALVLRCGVASPDGFDPAAAPSQDDPPPCTVVSGVGWFVPVSEARGGVTATFTAVGYRPRVSLTVLPVDQPEGGAGALSELAPVVKAHLERTPGVVPLPGQRLDPCS